ncbi:peptidoglycan editing factor PgeF [Prochlorococcus sp. MIT 1341]|uniref:peptidoglycan editing factor PgeF n=1 Tax=Prochlorococcus sp. MIT 1341 TaxID=3096221 RepID=UPI002A751E36|nr:peptidoglycan editing factor PgeF [Prochlorococcus sp. MIT 1341]
MQISLSTKASKKNEFAPKNIKDWSWINLGGNYYLEAKALRKHGFRHGFFTRQWSHKKPKELSSYLFNHKTVHMLRQKHTGNVLYASQAKQHPLPTADGLVSDMSKQSLWLYSADCIPIFFADPESGLVAACHAGWRGLTLRITSMTLRKLISIGAKIETLIIVMGPAISVDNYEVNTEIYEAIAKTLGDKFEPLKKSENWVRYSDTKESFMGNNKTEKVLIDLRLAASEQLIMEGVKASQIIICPICTMKEKNFFHSWRRDQIKATQWSCIANNQ